MITSQLVEAIAKVLNEEALQEATVFKLRQAHPGIHFTYCSDDDVGSCKAVWEQPDFNIYLVDGHDHCLKLTSEYSRATGLILAYCFDDEEDD